MIVDENQIPESFWRPQPPKLDRRELLAALKTGQEVRGAALRQRRRGSFGEDHVMTLTPAQLKALSGKLSFKHVKTRRTANPDNSRGAGGR